MLTNEVPDASAGTVDDRIPRRRRRRIVYVMTAPIPAAMWPYEPAYEWGATIKAFTVNRSC